MSKPISSSKMQMHKTRNEYLGNLGKFPQLKLIIMQDSSDTCFACKLSRSSRMRACLRFVGYDSDKSREE